ncbi:23810_t:CDS:2, partial [Gigaspora margarita]
DNKTVVGDNKNIEAEIFVEKIGKIDQKVLDEACETWMEMVYFFKQKSKAYKQKDQEIESLFVLATTGLDYKEDIKGSENYELEPLDTLYYEI